jgi:phage terminase large subunit-like protein
MTNIGGERRRTFSAGWQVISDMSASLSADVGFAAERSHITASTIPAASIPEIPTGHDGKIELSDSGVVMPGIDGARADLEMGDRQQFWANCQRYRQDWSRNGRDEQRPPDGDWRVWLLMGGRGSGKTRAGAEWVQELAAGKAARPGLRIALVAETLGDAREVMIDGVSGICRIARRNRPDFESSRRRLVWPNGTVAQVFSSEDPESLRGPQFDFAWCDELGKWKHGQETWDMLQFALRLGHHPRALVTTTPRPVPVLKALIADPGTTTRRIRTSDNTANLAPGFLSAMTGRYGGTRLGRQELDGEMIEDREDALWSRAGIEALKLRETGPLGRIVVGVDPPAGMGRESCCGIIVAGLDRSGRGVVLADCSVEGASPAGWAAAVVRAHKRFDADRIVAEVNQGGDMVSAVLRGIDAQLPVTSKGIARKVAAGGTGGGTLRAGPGGARRIVSGTGGPDV